MKWGLCGWWLCRVRAAQPKSRFALNALSFFNWFSYAASFVVAAAAISCSNRPVVSCLNKSIRTHTAPYKQTHTHTSVCRYGLICNSVRASQCNFRFALHSLPPSPPAPPAPFAHQSNVGMFVCICFYVFAYNPADFQLQYLSTYYIVFCIATCYFSYSLYSLFCLCANSLFSFAAFMFCVRPMSFFFLRSAFAFPTFGALHGSISPLLLRRLPAPHHLQPQPQPRSQSQLAATVISTYVGTYCLPFNARPT